MGVHIMDPASCAVSGGPNPAGHVIQPTLFPATYADIWRLDHDGYVPSFTSALSSVSNMCSNARRG